MLFLRSPRVVLESIPGDNVRNTYALDCLEYTHARLRV